MAAPWRKLQGDIHQPRWLYVKAALLLCIGVVASLLLLLEQPTLRTAALLALAIWGFCRAHYFAFYVVQHYADPNFRFAGLLAFLRYACRRKRNTSSEHQPPE